MGSQEYRLHVTKGMERGIVISDHVTDKNDYMYDTFFRAAGALKEIALHAAETHKGAEDDQEFALYQYSQNIIAFSGIRGQGKTSAMLSFSNMLKYEKERAEFDLDQYSFKVLPPIDPTTLEDRQDMLTIVLSRLFRETEKLYKKQLKERSRRFTELEKNEILSKIQRCLSHIGSLRKGFEYDGGKGMTQLHDIADSNDLKCELYELVDRILWLEDGGSGSDNQKFLVLQFDDTDFQVKRGYNILEDIRKYLTIPNVVILMATDMDLLRCGVTQNYLTDFGASFGHGLIQKNTVEQLGTKYIAKLVSPLYTAYLPQLEELIREKVHVKFAYTDDGKYLAPPAQEYVDQFSLQATVLRYIYQKTGMVFAAHNSYLHYIIPTTLRGLVQLLSLLSSMEDPIEADASTPAALKDTLPKRLDTLAGNIRLFDHYFLNDWIPAKLHKEFQDEMLKIASVDASELPYVIYRTILGHFPEGSEKYKTFAKRNSIDYWDVSEILHQYESVNRNPDSYKFVAAIHAYITIQCNLTVNQKMRSNIGEHTSDDPILFSVDDCTVLNKFYYPLGGLNELKYKDATIMSYRNRFGLLSVYAEFVGEELRKTGMLAGRSFQTWSQKQFYDVQCQILLMLCNWDVQKKINKEFELQKKMDRDTDGDVPGIEEVINIALLRINCAEKFIYAKEHNQANHPMLRFSTLSGDVTEACLTSLKEKQRITPNHGEEQPQTEEENSRINVESDPGKILKACIRVCPVPDAEQKAQIIAQAKESLGRGRKSRKYLRPIMDMIAAEDPSFGKCFETYCEIVHDALGDKTAKSNWKTLYNEQKSANPNS